MYTRVSRGRSQSGGGSHFLAGICHYHDSVVVVVVVGLDGKLGCNIVVALV